MGSVRLKQALSAWSKLAAMQRIPLGFAQCKKIFKKMIATEHGSPHAQIEIFIFLEGLVGVQCFSSSHVH